MMASHDETLNACELQMALKLVLKRAHSQIEAERAALAAAVAIVIAGRGAVVAVDMFRDLADIIERDAVLQDGENLH